MPAAPFHRRILPWVFAISFLAVAPAVIFYTAGYRYNPKKNTIERNGTVIIDSAPRGANILLDGTLISDKTPITLQDVSPGSHQFEIQKAGYSSWSKALDVHAELVTFLNTVRLWKQSSPQQFSDSPADLVSLSPDDGHLLIVSSTPTAAYEITDQGAHVLMQGKLSPAPSGKLEAIWNNDSSAVLLQSATSGSWLLDVGRTHQTVALPTAQYRFESDELVGNDGTAIISILLNDLTVQRTPLEGVADVGVSADLRHATGTQELVLVMSNDPKEGIILPQGNWNIAAEENKDTIVRDGNNWLSVLTSNNPPSSHTASGDMLRPLTLNHLTRYLLIDGGELWLWDPSQDPELLLRQSDPLIDAAWHYQGNDVFYATDKAVYALNLDPRDGYEITQLASFDDIDDITASSVGTLYIAGTKDGISGVWSLATE